MIKSFHIYYRFLRTIKDGQFTRFLPRESYPTGQHFCHMLSSNFSFLAFISGYSVFICMIILKCMSWKVGLYLFTTERPASTTVTRIY